jgi:hypothetical protein
MDCRTARDILDVIRPGAVDPADAEVSAAVAHLEDCDDCLLALRAHQALDRRIGRAIRDVPVPSGLRERLHAALAESAAECAGGSAETVSTAASNAGSIPVGAAIPAPSMDASGRPRRRGRTRGVRLAAVAAAVVLLVTAVWFFNREGGPRATLARVYAEAPLDPAVIEPFEGSFDPVLPSGGWMSRVVIAPKPTGSSLGLGGEHVVALYRFRFRGRDGAAVYGVLAVAPAESIDASRVLPSSFEAADADYPDRRMADGRPLGARAWSSDGFVYICFVPADRLDELGQLLDLPIG